MSSPTLYGQVESTITTIQQALIRLLIRHADVFRIGSPSSSSSSSNTTTTTTTTTSLSQLKHATFGLANEDTLTNKISTPAGTAEETIDDTMIGITLQIGVILERESHGSHEPNTTTTDSSVGMDYPTQQQQHLLMYHLRKYAAALNATLLFINTDLSTSASSFGAVTATAGDIANTTTTTGMIPKQPTIHVRELPWLWKALAHHQPIWRYRTIEDMEAGGAVSESVPVVDDNTALTVPPPTDSSTNNNDDTNIYSYIYGPENHNTEWIESVLVRNANYPGHWDATKDSIWKVFSSPSKSLTTTKDHSNSTAKTNDTAGDQLWLKELYDSIVPVLSSSSTNTTLENSSNHTATLSSHQLQTPPPSSNPNKVSATSTNTKTKTPNDAAVSSFFEDLLK